MRPAFQVGAVSSPANQPAAFRFEGIRCDDGYLNVIALGTFEYARTGRGLSGLRPCSCACPGSGSLGSRRLCCKKNKGTDAIDDFHGVLLFRGTLWLGEGS
jgi:hypothetical protein